MKKKSFETEKPYEGQVIIFKEKGAYLPEIGVFEVYPGGVEAVYVPANDDHVELLENIEWWCEIPE